MHGTTEMPCSFIVQQAVKQTLASISSPHVLQQQCHNFVLLLFVRFGILKEGHGICITVKSRRMVKSLVTYAFDFRNERNAAMPFSSRHSKMNRCGGACGEHVSIESMSNSYANLGMNMPHITLLRIHWCREDR